MDTESLLALIGAGLALAGSPGPNTMSLAAAGAAYGATRSLAYMSGLALGMLVVMIIVATGVVGMLLTVPGVAPIAAIVAVIYFVYLAWRIATAPPLSERSDPRPAPSSAAGLALSLTNPKGYAAMLALFSGHIVIRDRLLADAVLKVAVTMAIIVLVNIAWLLVGAGLARYLRSPRASRILNLAFAALLLASAVALLPR
ncbi:MAG TPA: LysE family translocator [Dongiaceae bacterium]|jgi:threonine/homoserine/homoserine lactone efflux protein|nr:LysE family translocator [Dongiaceae bacterium]